MAWKGKSFTEASSTKPIALGFTRRETEWFKVRIDGIAFVFRGKKSTDLQGMQYNIKVF